MILEVTPSGSISAFDQRDPRLDTAQALRKRVIAAELLTRAELGVGLRMDAADPDGVRNRVDLAQFHASVQERLLRPMGRMGAPLLQQMHTDGLIRADQARDLGIRADADFGAGGGVAANLVVYAARVLREPAPVLNISRVCAMFNTLPPGATDYQFIKVESSGQAKLWAGGEEGDYNVSTGITASTMRQAWLMSSGHITVLDEARFSMMNVNQEVETRRQLELGHLITHNRLGWLGDSKARLLGLRNQPGLAQAGSGLSLATCTGDELLGWAIGLIRTPVEESKQVYAPTVLMVGVKTMTKMKRLTISGSDAKSVYEVLRMRFPEVSIEEANELDDFFATDLHAAFAFPRGSDAAPVMEAAPPYFLPVYVQGIGIRLYCVSRYGGVVVPAPVGARMGVIAS